MYGHLKCSVYSIWDPLTRLYPTWYQLLVKKKMEKKKKKKKKKKKETWKLKTRETLNAHFHKKQKQKSKGQRLCFGWWGSCTCSKGKRVKDRESDREHLWPTEIWLQAIWGREQYYFLRKKYILILWAYFYFGS